MPLRNWRRKEVRDNNNISTWDAFSDYIIEHASKCDDFFLLSSTDIVAPRLFDSIPSDKMIFRSVSASNLVLNAAGLAIEGKRPIVLSSSPSIVIDGYRKIRDGLAIPSMPVSIAVADSGLSRGSDGTSCNVLEDIALMRSLPNMNIFVPSGKASVVLSAENARQLNAPSYFRLSNTKVLRVDDVMSADSNGMDFLTSGTDVTICACGVMVDQALRAFDVLEQGGISAEIVDCCKIKPFPEQILLSSVRKTGCCVVAEEHSSIGGLSSAVSDCLSKTYPVATRFVAVENQFVNSGTPDELREYYGLTWKEIVNAAAEVWALRRR